MIERKVGDKMIQFEMSIGMDMFSLSLIHILVSVEYISL